MLTTQELIGKAVVERGGARLGEIGDVIVAPRRPEVLALLLRPTLFQPSFSIPRGGEDVVLPFESVFELRARDVVVAVPDDLVPIGRLPKVKFAREHGPQAGRTLLVSSAGARLGVVQDLRFDAESARVIGYEVAARGAPTRLVYVPAQHAPYHDEALRLTPRADSFFAHMAREPL